MVPLFGSQWFFGIGLHRNIGPALNDMGTDLPVLEPEIPALVIISSIHAGKDCSVGFALHIDKSSVRKAVLTVKITVITNLHSRAVTHLQSVAIHAGQCPDFGTQGDWLPQGCSGDGIVRRVD